MLSTIFRHKYLLEYEPEEIRFGGCVMLRDFGPWKKDQGIDIFFVQLESGLMEERDYNGNVKRSCNLALEAV